MFFIEIVSRLEIEWKVKWESLGTFSNSGFSLARYHLSGHFWLVSWTKQIWLDEFEKRNKKVCLMRARITEFKMVTLKTINMHLHWKLLQVRDRRNHFGLAGPFVTKTFIFGSIEFKIGQFNNRSDSPLIPFRLWPNSQPARCGSKSWFKFWRIDSAIWWCWWKWDYGCERRSNIKFKLW